MKAFLIFIGLLIVGCLLLLVFVPYYAVNTYRAQIIAEISKHTGYHVNIDGQIGLKTLPDLQLTLPKFSVHTQHADGTVNEKILEAKSASLHLDTMKALLHQEILITRIALDTPYIYLRQEKNGEWNAIAGTAKKKAADADIAEDSTTKSRFKVNDFSLESLTITGATADITPVSGKKIMLKHLSLDTGYSMRPDFHAFSVTADDIVINKDATGPVSLSGQYMIEHPMLVLKEAVLRYKDHQFNGSVNVNTASTPVSITTDVSAPSISLPRLTGADTSGNSSKKSSADAQQPPVPFSVPDFSSVTLDATVRTDKLTVKHGVDIAPAHLALTNEGGTLHATVKEAGLAGGNITGTVTVRERNNLPALNLKVTADNLNPDAIPEVLLPEKPPLTGVIAMNADVNATGNTVDTLLNTFSGAWHITARDGTVPENNFTRMLTTGNNIINALRGKDGITLTEALKNQPESNGAALIFSKASADFTLNNGVMNTDNLAIDSDFINVTGSGTLNLPKKTVDMRFLAAASKVKHADTLAKYVPVRVTGPFSKPSIKPDMSGGLGEALKSPEAAKKLIEDIISDTDALKDKAGKTLRRLRDNIRTNKKNENNGADAPKNDNVIDSILGTFGR